MKPKTMIIIGALSLFVLLNILSSQSISTLFLGFSKGDKDSSVNLLQKIRRESYFQSFYSGISGFFGEDLNDAVYSESRNRQEKISQLENLLIRSPKARDVLYNLYILYQKEDDEQTAQQYLQRAKEVDPEIR